MRFLLFGHFVACGALFTASCVISPEAWWDSPSPLMRLWLMVLLPVITAWITIEVIHMLRPRRWFVSRDRHTAGLVLLGVLACAVAAGLSIPALAYINPALLGASGDHLIVAATTMMAMSIITLLLPRRVPGHCVQCNYDLRAMPPDSAGRCPECGEEMMMTSQA